MCTLTNTQLPPIEITLILWLKILMTSIPCVNTHTHKYTRREMGMLCMFALMICGAGLDLKMSLETRGEE